MLTSVISADIVASTSLNDAGRLKINEALNELFEKLKQTYNIYARIIKGDYVECVVPQPENALLVALCIKSLIKSLAIQKLTDKEDNRYKNFKIHGIKIVIGYGELSRFDPAKGIIDGEAIYLSGRKMNELSSHGKERIIIKNTMFFVSSNENLNIDFEALMALLDVLISKATAKQCKVLLLKLLQYNEEEIAKELKVSQPVINQHSTAIGWNAIERAIQCFAYKLKT